MTVHYQDESVTVYHGDCLPNPALRKQGVTDEVLKSLPDNSVDAVVTDPPYGISFMRRSWDGADIEACAARGRETSSTSGSVGGPADECRSAATEAGRYGLSANAAFGEWCREWATECLRILKPGGYLLSFGGSRTWHRLAGGIEDAGFEMRDSIAWLYSQGFPKSHDVSKAIDKAAGAERAVISQGAAVKRMVPGADQNKLGSWIKDNGREYVPTVTAAGSAEAQQWAGWGTALKPAFEPIVVARKPLVGSVAQNVLEYGTGALNIDACRVAHRGEADLSESMAKNRHADFGSKPRENRVFGADERSRASLGNYDGSAGRWPANVLLDDEQALELDRQSGVSVSRTAAPRDAAPGAGWGMTRTGAEYADSGGASRFFPVFRYGAKATGAERPTVDGVSHPTVKPLDLLRWLVRLATPPNGLVLDPFAGSGTTAEACIHEHMRCITIEREADYLPLIVARLTKPIEVGFDFQRDAS